MTNAELKEILSNPLQLIEGDTLNATKCKDLAEALMSQFWIAKGSRHYWITDLEFYLYTDRHKDIITYPRKCKAGKWFFHASGVDITFESTVDLATNPKNKKWMPVLTKDAVFGGILIRGIEPVERLDVPEDAILMFDGPWKACDELFDGFDAFGQAEDFPQIEACAPRHIKLSAPIQRKGLSIDSEKKVHTILTGNYAAYDERCEKEMVAEYAKYRVKPYRFKL